MNKPRPAPAVAGLSTRSFVSRGLVIQPKGWMPVTVAGGVEYTPAVLKRYPAVAAPHGNRMAKHGLAVPA